MRNKFSFSRNILYGAILMLVLLLVMKPTGQGIGSLDENARAEPYAWMGDEEVLYKRLHRISDSMRRINNCYEQAVPPATPWYNRLFARLIKIDTTNTCDTALSTAARQDAHYLVLPGYSLPTGTESYVKDGRYFFYTTDLSTIKEGDYDPVFTTKPVDVRFTKIYSNKIDVVSQQGYFLIPIDAKSFNTARFFFYVFGGILALLALWVLVVLPVKMVYSIFRRDFFSLANARYCLIIGWCVIGFAFLIVLTSLILYFTFHYRQPYEVSYFAPFIFEKVYGTLLAGLLILVLNIVITERYHSDTLKKLTI